MAFLAASVTPLAAPAVSAAMIAAVTGSIKTYLLAIKSSLSRPSRSETAFSRQSETTLLPLDGIVVDQTLLVQRTTPNFHKSRLSENLVDLPCLSLVNDKGRYNTLTGKLRGREGGLLTPFAVFYLRGTSVRK